MVSQQELDQMRLEVLRGMDAEVLPLFEELDRLGKSIEASIKAINVVMRANGIEPGGPTAYAEGR